SASARARGEGPRGRGTVRRETPAVISPGRPSYSAPSAAASSVIVSAPRGGLRPGPDPQGEARGPLGGEVGPGPGEHHDEAVAEADQEEDVDGQPGHPGHEAPEAQASDERHR